MVLSVTHGFIEYCGIHCYVHQPSDVSIGGLLKAHSTEGSYCDSTQLRALIGSGPFFPDVLPTLGLKWLTLPTDIHKHTQTRDAEQTDIKDKVCNQEAHGRDIKETTNKSESQPQIKGHRTDTRHVGFSAKLTGLCSHQEGKNIFV